MPTASDVSRLLKLNLEMADFSSFVPFIRSGFSRQCFDEFLSGTTIASTITQLSAFNSLAQDAKELSPEASDCLLRIARVYAEALELFGGKEDVAQWMVTESLTLGNQTPLELMDTTVGFELVYHELKRLQYGIAG
jgi:putative toxin-antitoxin system antitoxin component (TIGR02293 family)